MKNKLVNLFLSFLALCMAGTINAQLTKINGVVSNSNGIPLTGAKITSVEGKNKAFSGRDGQYSLEINDKSSAVIFSMAGYQSQTVQLSFDEETNVSLERAETYDLDETVFFGNQSQRKGELTGAVSTVTSEVLDRAPVGNLSQSLTGRLPGLYTYEGYSEPSRTSTTLRLRGTTTIRGNGPLVVIDGFPYAYNSNELFEYISAMEVDNIAVLKDASAQALYGIQGADGVIVITTKRGSQGKLKIDLKIDQTFEQTSTKRTFIGSDEFIPMRNQAGYNDGLGRYNFFSKEVEDHFVAGDNKELYPSNDWRALNMREISNMQRVNLNVTGGNSRALIFTNLNVMHQDGMWKTDQTKYDPNNNFVWANFRSNVDVKLNDYLSAMLNLSGNIKREKTPGNSALTYGFADVLYYRMYSLPPYIYGPVTPKVIDPVTGETLDEGGGVVVTPTEPYTAYAAINRVGYYQHTVTNIYAQSALKIDLGFLTKGLDLAGYAGYQTNAVRHFSNSQTFANWVRTSNYDELEFVRIGTAEDTPLRTSVGYSFYYNLNFKGILNYNRNFGAHHVNGVGYALYQALHTADTGSPAFLPYKRINSGVSVSYDYGDRYYLKLDLGYSGSEQYSKENRFTAFPAISAGWVLSNESFIKEQASWLSYLKLRASYGKAGVDRSGLGRYVYMDNITLTGGAHIGYLAYTVNEQQAANPFISPEIVKKQNYGFDLTLFNNLAISANVFREKTDNMVSGGVSIIPDYQGIPLGYYPKVNTGIFENKGYEITLDYTKEINKDLTFNLGGWIANSKNKVVYNDETERADDYAFRKREEGYPFGQQWGYIVDKSNGNGYFNSQEEIDNSNLSYEIGTPRPGYLKYYDLNNDGIINDKDVAPLGHGNNPSYVYAFHGELRYRNFDLSVMFQGVADFYIIDMSASRTEQHFEGVYSALHRKAWTAERYANGEEITYPALSTIANSNNTAASTFFLEDKSYLRLKNMVIGYTFPKKISNVIGADKLRLYMNGQNLLTWHHLDLDDYGPEGNIWSIPVYRLYNIGLSVTF